MLTPLRPVRVAVLVAVAGLFAAAVRADDDPFAPPKDPKKPAPAEKGKVEPGGGDSLRVPFDHRKPVTFGPADCPVLLAGTDVWDVKTFKIIGQIEGEYDPQARRAVSADGRWFAAAAKSPNQTSTTVTVWNTQTGKPALTVPGKAEAYVDLLAFSRNKYLLLGGRHNKQIDVWDIEKGEIIAKKVTVPDRRIEPDKITFSPSGQLFACIAHDKIVVTDTATNKAVATMVPPPVTPLMAPGAKPGPRPKGNPTDAIFVYAWTNVLAFAPDGSELAAFSTHPHPRLLIWNAKGALVVDEPVPMPRFVGHKSSLEWMPDRSALLVNGFLFDRTTKRVLLSVHVPFAADVHPHILDRNRIAAVLGGDENVVQTVSVPWDKLAASLKQLTDKSPAYLTPADPVSLEFVADAETQQILTEVLTSRLTRDGLRVAPGQSTVLRVKMTTEAGETLPIYERQSAFDRRGRDTGKTATEVKGAALLEIVTKDQPTPLWRGHLTASSARSFTEEITDASIRKSMLEHLVRQLQGMDMPYFIPKSAEFLALPAVVE